MVDKWSKNKPYSQRHQEQAEAERQKLVIYKKSQEAYWTLTEFWVNNPPSGVCRNRRGDLLEIVPAGDSFTCQELPDSKRELGHGQVWMPQVPSGRPGTLFDEAVEYGPDKFKYVWVEPTEISLNLVLTNGTLNVYQPRPMFISQIDGGLLTWEPVSTGGLDPSRECLVVSQDGRHIQTCLGANLPPGFAPPPAPVLVPAPVPAPILAPASVPASALGGFITSPFDSNSSDLLVGTNDPANMLDNGTNLLFADNNSAGNSYNDDMDPFAGYAPGQGWRPT